MAYMELVIEPDWHEHLRKILDPRMDDLVDAIASDARRYAPFDTGNLEEHIEPSRVSRDLWRVSSEAAYTLYVEYDTRPHVIRARYKKALYWFDDTGGHLAKQVQHPGTREQPFMRPALFQERQL